MSSSYITDSTPAGAFETITVSSTAIGPTASLLKSNQIGGHFKRAVRAFITNASNSIRIRFDGTDPTTTVGHVIAAGDYFTIDGEANVSRLKMIAVGSDGVASVTYFYNL